MDGTNQRVRGIGTIRCDWLACKFRAHQGASLPADLPAPLPANLLADLHLQLNLGRLPAAHRAATHV